MSKIFISYRRADSQHITGRIYDRLERTFGERNLFLDIDTIGGGKDFRGELHKATSTCQVMLVIIGPKWLTDQDEKGNRRLDNLDDFVRLEIGIGLQRQDIVVIPVLVKNADMPSAEQLPDNLKELAYRNALRVDSDHNFNSNIKSLIREIRPNLSRNFALPIDWSWIIGAVMIPIIAAIITIVPDILNNQVEAISSLEQMRVTESNITEAPTVSETDEIVKPTNKSTPAPSVTESSSNSLIPLSNMGNPVISNNEWMPFEKEFNGVIMVKVPVGCFMMGDSLNTPVHEQCIDKIFWIDKYEVTNDRYGSLRCTDYSSQPNQPHVCVDWFSAKAHCESRGARLPSEMEWEYAVRGPNNLIYPWGNVYEAENVVGEDDPIYGDKSTAPVGSRPEGASWVGALDMSGNAWEWVSSIYGDYPYDTVYEDSKDTTSARVVRGGSFDNDYFNLRSTLRSWYLPFSSNYTIGFRCARDYDE